MASSTKLKQILEDKESFFLICHVDPDGDAIGSILALDEYLIGQGKKTTLLCRDTVPDMFTFLPGAVKISMDFPVDPPGAIILLDNGDFRRTGYQEEITRAKKSGVSIINIDHHPKNDLWKKVSLNYADESLSSTCEVLYGIFADLSSNLTSAMATALLTGIYFDTGGFRHSNTTDEVLSIASDLLKKGARLQKITENIDNSRSFSLFKLWGIALERLRLNRKYGISVSVITAEDIAKAGASEEEVSGLVNLLNSAPESEVAMLLCESFDAKIKGSLRTESDKIDVSRLAKLFGGGGHKKAAGFTIDGRIKIVDNRWTII
ncbi:MAG: DHH family phosphoesterase [Patescibacteria group bacterium]|jgi:phosphoesterase RecJ-like protein